MNEILVDFEFAMDTYYWLGCPSLSHIITQGFSKNGSNSPSPMTEAPTHIWAPFVCVLFTLYPLPLSRPLPLLLVLQKGSQLSLARLASGSSLNAQPSAWKWPLSSLQSARSEAWDSLPQMHLHNAALKTVTLSNPQGLLGAVTGLGPRNMAADKMMGFIEMKVYSR